jgi:hypothetical protein
MPVKLPDAEREPLRAGDYYVHRRTGRLVEIMHVDLSGNCQVLDVEAPLDGEWQLVTASQISSCVWQRVEALTEAA